MGSTDLDAMKGIPKQNSVCVCMKLGDSLKGIHYSISFLFCPDALIGICMTLHASAVYCTQAQTTIYLLLFSIFVLPAGNPQKLKALNPTTQTLQKCVFVVHLGPHAHLTECD